MLVLFMGLDTNDLARCPCRSVWSTDDRVLRSRAVDLVEHENEPASAAILDGRRAMNRAVARIPWVFCPFQEQDLPRVTFSNPARIRNDGAVDRSEIFPRLIQRG